MALAGDLNLLHALRALLEDRNVTHAGDRIGMSQPAMSGALARLRRHFRDDLLVRVGRDYELTPLAETLLPLVRETVDLAERTLQVRPTFDPMVTRRTFTIVLSDYALTVLVELLLRRTAIVARAVRIDFKAIPDDLELADMERLLLRQDLMIAPAGSNIPGRGAALFHDRFVCVLDRDNRLLDDTKITLDALRELPHAVAHFGRTNVTPVDRRLAELGVERRIEVGVHGFLPLPFVVAGTDLVAFIPQRLARRFSSDPRIAVVDPPFDCVELVDTMYWHPSRENDPGHQWLRLVISEVAQELLGSEPCVDERYSYSGAALEGDG